MGQLIAAVLMDRVAGALLEHNGGGHFKLGHILFYNGPAEAKGWKTGQGDATIVAFLCCRNVAVAYIGNTNYIVDNIRVAPTSKS